MAPLTAMRPAAERVPVFEIACRVTETAAFSNWGIPPMKGICASHESGPMTVETFPIETLRNALTIRGSK
jgi:hypothetical protein